MHDANKSTGAARKFGAADAYFKACLFVFVVSPRPHADPAESYRADMCRDGVLVGGGGSGARHAGSGVIATVTTSGYLFIAPDAASTPSPMMPPKITLPAAMVSVFEGLMLDPSR